MEIIYSNGISGENGEYFTPPISSDLIAQIACGEKIEKAHYEELKWWYKYTRQKRLGPIEGVNPKVIAETGWGVIFAQADPNASAIKEKLAELLAMRREQAGKYYKEFFGESAFDGEESKLDFLARHGMGPGPANPLMVPYYLLIVGDPELIPFHFQYQLDVQYAVGRIHFENLEDYASYARNVVSAENGNVKRPKQAVFFGVQNQNDPATNLSAQHLVTPLSEFITKDQKDWTIQTFLKEKATKAQLNRHFGGEETPALLFTASHGMGFRNGNPEQLRHQGALICQDWKGPGNMATSEHYFSADDVADDAELTGLISFHFACFSAGSPKMDEFAFKASKEAIAPCSFISRLSQRLLAHPKGAQAFVGHVERAWGYSFVWGNAGRQLQVFESTLKRLMEGHPIGSALEFFNERYAELSSELTVELERLNYNLRIPDNVKLAKIWTANNDARGYTIIGDPAVRLSVGS